MSKTIVLKHNDISNPHIITGETTKAFKEHGLDIHINEVQSLEDDHKKGIRILEVKNTKHHFIGSVPWHKGGI